MSWPGRPRRSLSLPIESIFAKRSYLRVISRRVRGRGTDARAGYTGNGIVRDSEPAETEIKLQALPLPLLTA